MPLDLYTDIGTEKFIDRYQEKFQLNEALGYLPTLFAIPQDNSFSDHESDDGYSDIMDLPKPISPQTDSEVEYSDIDSDLASIGSNSLTPSVSANSSAFFYPKRQLTATQLDVLVDAFLINLAVIPNFSDLIYDCKIDANRYTTSNAYAKQVFRFLLQVVRKENFDNAQNQITQLHNKLHNQIMNIIKIMRDKQITKHSTEEERVAFREKFKHIKPDLLYCLRLCLGNAADIRTLNLKQLGGERFADINYLFLTPEQRQEIPKVLEYVLEESLRQIQAEEGLIPSKKLRL